MKAVYTCDHCSYTTSDIEAMKAHESAHKDAEILATRINALIAEYNSKYGETFKIARYTPNISKKDKPAKAHTHIPAKAERPDSEPPATNSIDDTKVLPGIAQMISDIADTFCDVIERI